MTNSNPMHDLLPAAQHLAAGSDRMAFFACLLVMGTAFAWYARQQAMQKVELIRQLSALHSERISEFKALMQDYRELTISVRDALTGHRSAIQDLVSEMKETRHRQ